MQRNPEAAERRPIDDLLDQVFAETGDAAFATRDDTNVEPDPSPAASPAAAIAAIEEPRREAKTESALEVRAARHETRQALDDIFGDEVDPAAASASRPPRATSVQTAVAEPALEVQPALAVDALASEPVVPQRTHRPQVILGGENDNPEWTRHLVPVLLLALLAGAGVAGLAALILG